jgi:hypothetical protein
MNVEIGTEAAQFSENEYINGILVECRRLVIKENIHYYKNLILHVFFYQPIEAGGPGECRWE